MALDFRFRWIKTKLFQIGAVRIDEISTDGTMAGNSDTAVPTEKAVKAYVDTKATLGNELKDDPAPTLSADLKLDGHDIIDTDGNKILEFSEAADAVNNFMVASAAAGEAPDLMAVGDDTNIDVSITPKGTGDIKLNGEVVINNLVNFKAAVGTSGELTGATGTITLNVPVGAWVIGYSMNNDVATTDDDGDGTYTAAFAGGLTSDLNDGNAIAAAQNTKVTAIGGIGITTGALSIVLTPDGTSFTGGEVSATVVYLTIEELADA
jgi:hypothetical protein